MKTMSGDAWKTSALTGMNGPACSVHSQNTLSTVGIDLTLVLTVLIARFPAYEPSLCMLRSFVF